MTPAKIAAALKMRAAGEQSVTEIAEALGVSRASVYRALANAGSSAPVDRGASARAHREEVRALRQG